MINNNTLQKLFLYTSLFLSMTQQSLANNSLRGEVVTTIAPVHALVSQLLQGSGVEATLLVADGESLHGYRLKPSQYRVLSQAKMVFMISAHLESFLTKPLQSFQGALRIVTLAENPAIELLEKNHQHEQSQDLSAHKMDYHLWLDPLNSIEMLTMISAALIQQYPSQEALFVKNRLTAQHELEALHESLLPRMEKLQNSAYIVFHDAYGYFEHRYGLHRAGVISVNPSQGLSAKQVKKIKQTLVEKKVSCVFSEPQFPRKIIQTFTQGHNLKVEILNPLYADVNDVTSTISRLAEAFSACLNKP